MLSSAWPRPRHVHATASSQLYEAGLRLSFPYLLPYPLLWPSEHSYEASSEASAEASREASSEQSSEVSSGASCEPSSGPLVWCVTPLRLSRAVSVHVNLWRTAVEIAASHSRPPLVLYEAPTSPL